MDVAALPALEIARLVRGGDLSPVEVVDEFLSRIARVNPAINAYVWVREDGARADARRLAERVARGEDPGPLAGVPVSFEVLVATAEGPMTLGSRAFEDFSPGFDATMVERVLAAGAVFLGKTNAPELGARPTTESVPHGATRNPWNPERTAGGSSGGEAAACAAGLSPLAPGFDGGGSIRIPASACGIFGLKPSRGRVTRGPIGGEGWGGLSIAGPMARTVADAAALLDVMAGPSTGDPYWAPPPDRPFAGAVAERPRLRVAVTTELEGIPTDPEVRAAVDRVASLLSDLGHAVEESSGPPVAPLEGDFSVITGVGIGSAPEVPPERRHLLEPRTRRFYEFADQTPAAIFARALFNMQTKCRAVVAFFDDWDLLLTPTLNYPPPPIGAIGASDDPVETWQDYRLFHAFTWPFNMTGQPAASVPFGFSADELPIGVQLVGRPNDEHTVIAAAAVLEREKPWSDRLPPAW